MTKRDVAITWAKIAGHHDDAKAFTRLIIESRVSRPVMTQAWQTGVRLREAGTVCTCWHCREGR